MFIWFGIWSTQQAALLSSWSVWNTQLSRHWDLHRSLAPSYPLWCFTKMAWRCPKMSTSSTKNCWRKRSKRSWGGLRRGWQYINQYHIHWYECQFFSCFGGCSPLKPQQKLANLVPWDYIPHIQKGSWRWLGATDLGLGWVSSSGSSDVLETCQQRPGCKGKVNLNPSWLVEWYVVTRHRDLQGRHFLGGKDLCFHKQRVCLSRHWTCHCHWIRIFILSLGIHASGIENSSAIEERYTENLQGLE